MGDERKLAEAPTREELLKRIVKRFDTIQREVQSLRDDVRYLLVHYCIGADVGKEEED